jgi:hypothetical protein
MRANIITAPVFPGGAADGAAVVGMMVGGAQAPWVGFREKNTYGTSASHPGLPECPSPISVA